MLAGRGTREGSTLTGESQEGARRTVWRVWRAVGSVGFAVWLLAGALMLAVGLGARWSAAPTAPLTTSPSATSAESSRTPAMPAPHTVWTVGYSLQNRPIVAETFGTGPRRILIFGGIHGNEFGGPVAQQFLAYVRANPSAVPAGTELDIIADANPDGSAIHGRGNANNVDINRNFPSANWVDTPNLHGTLAGVRPASEPETLVLLALLDEQHYARIVSLHSAGGLIDFDGPGGRAIAHRMAEAAHTKVTKMAAYYGSMGSYVPPRYGIPIITWELTKPQMDAPVLAGLLAALR
jgi:murein peptide amidase A